MNEPSVFTSSTNTEVTMPKNSIHILPNYSRPIEHSEVHNAYGFYYHVASYDGLIKRDPNKRPFILTRSHFVGTQKYGAVWTGDNHAYWDHLEVSVPMVLSQAIAGISFIGADVGGFFQDPEPELIQRWTQLGAFYPFFRAHSHIETKKREPWLFGTEHVDIIRAATKIRYHLLPFWYTLFRKYAASSVPVITPLFIKTQNSLLVVEDQLFVGNAILVKPAIKPQQTSVEIKTGQDYPFWYNFYNLQKIEVQDSQIIKAIDKNEIGVLIKPGSILVTYKEVFKSSEMMKKFPYTLIIALDQNNQAQGAFYDDDWTSFSFQQGQYVESNLIFKNLELSNELLNNSYESESQHLVAEIKILGLEKQFQDVKVNGVTKEAYFSFSSQVLTITNLEIRLNQAWKISFSS